MPTTDTDTNMREMRGLAIAAKGAQIKRINKLSYTVRSQSNGQWYSVVKHYGNSIERTKACWTCTCPDHVYRKSQCKQICAVLYSKELRREVLRRTGKTAAFQDVAEVITEVSTSSVNQEGKEEIICSKCKGADTVKDGIRHTKHGTDIQRYSCKNCHFRFVVNTGFERARADGKVITAALDLYFKGVSLRKVCDHLKQFYGIEITHGAIIKWIRKFVKLVKPYVDQIEPPHLSGIYHVDEMMVHVRKEKMEKGDYQWLWNLMDNTTRFWICTRVSQKREVADGRAIFQEANKIAPKKPIALVHDGLPSYNEAFQKEFYTLKNPRTMNIRSVSVRNEGLNSKVERLNGSVRDREVVMRGMDHKESAQTLMEAMRIYHNYVRTHQGLDGRTPAEASGIKIEGENKLMTLIRNASMKQE
jgi:putative transposase